MRSSSMLPAVGLCVALVVASRPASAFCRTTTSMVPNGYNPADDGCWTDGKPLAWHIARVPIGLISAASSQLSLSDATRVEDLAIAAWNHVTCSGQSPSVQVYNDGPIAQAPQSGCTSSASCDPAANDYVVFDDSGWPHDDPTNALGLTTVTFGVDDGRIFAAYTEINSAQHQLSTQEPAPDGTYDLQAILTHETGHFLGLAHATDQNSIMYAYYHQGAIDLTPDDEDGLCAIYPPGGPPGGGDPGGSGGGCAVPPAVRESGDASGVSGAVLAAIALVVTAAARRRRASS